MALRPQKPEKLSSILVCKSEIRCAKPVEWHYCGLIYTSSLAVPAYNALYDEWKSK